ncbi:hypothetical protein HYY74_05860 [Candidatus Woesearchaeota archaeon]|nr:hypothetical protein [Candidatus Woesearchaeota archaeon]
MKQVLMHDADVETVRKYIIGLKSRGRRSVSPISIVMECGVAAERLPDIRRALEREGLVRLE